MKILLFTKVPLITIKMLVTTFADWPPSVNFINVIRSAFALVDPKSIKNTVKVISVFLRFWDLRA